MPKSDENDDPFNKSTIMLRSPQNESLPTNAMSKLCVLCTDTDSEKMVTCTVCGFRYHHRCLKQGSEIVSETFCCRKCRKQRLISQARPRPESNSSNQHRDNPLTGNTALPTNEQTNVIHRSVNTVLNSDKNINLGGKSSTQQSIHKENDKGSQNFSNQHPNDGYNKKTTTGCTPSQSVSSEHSRKSLRKRKELALSRLDEELRLQREREIAYLNRKYEILEEELSDESIENDTEPPLNQTDNNVEMSQIRTEAWVGDQGRSKVSFNESRMDPNLNNPVLPLNGAIPEDQNTRVHISANRSSLAPWLSARNQNEFFNSTSLHAGRDPVYEPSGLSLRQIAIRQTVSKDLPVFSGEPSEWPMFISSFVRSTRTCNFTDEENLIRLQRSLKGKALDAVRSKLIFPETVPKVLNTLRMLFGRPQLILQMMINQLKKEPPVNAEKLESVLHLSMSVQHLCAVIEASEMTDHLNNPLLLQELVHKLPGILKLNWATFIMGRKKVDLSTFNDWLYDLADAAGSVVSYGDSTFNKTEERSERRFQGKGRNFVNAHVNTPVVSRGRNAQRLQYTPNTGGVRKTTCRVCSDGCHRIPDCKKFLDMIKSERWNCMRDNRLCRKCLEYHHVTKCQRYKECGVNGCTFKHHPLLHDPNIHQTSDSKPSAAKNNDNVGATTSGINSTPKDNNIVATTSVTIPIKNHRQLLFRIVPVILYGKNTSVKTFAFLDEGSSLTLIEDELVQTLNLDGPVEDLFLKWTGNTTRQEQNSRRVSLEISGLNIKGPKYQITDVRTVKSLDLPIQSLRIDPNNSEYRHLRGLPFHQYENAQPKLLIGLQHWRLAVPLRVREGEWGEPIAADTRLGWTVYGSFHHITANETRRAEIHHISQSHSKSYDDIHRQVSEFFTTENFGVKCPISVIESKDDIRANKLLRETTRKLGNKYITGLLWHYDKIELPNSFPMAMRRLVSLERRMEKEPDLARNLREQIEQYTHKGYARRLDPEEAKISTSRTWYLPIFAVSNPNKPGKTRIVWDAAAEVNGISLNSVLMKGPDLLSSLSDILHRFQEHPVALAADIKEMFHRIGIREEDQQSQRFLWRYDKNREPDVYVMSVMTFGATCSPSCAQFIKNLNAQEYEKTHPRSFYAIRHNHYVDDWLDGFVTEEDAITTAKSVIQIHSSGGFEIRNFISNSPRVLNALGCESVAEMKNLNMNGDSGTLECANKVLGMWWSTVDDHFYYNLDTKRLDDDIISGKRRPTKREVLRVVMMMFDPLGLIATVIVYAKILLRDIWRAGINWDDPIDESLFTRWMKWISILPELREINIPRCYSPLGYESLQLHIFVDASENAFASVAYFRIETNHGVHCRLVSAKTKVAPQKSMTIPRLELQAAVLGTRLATSICKAHNIQPSRKCFWSDSTDVLTWLRSDNKRYRQFVAFRVSEILETTNQREWRWVVT